MAANEYSENPGRSGRESWRAGGRRRARRSAVDPAGTTVLSERDKARAERAAAEASNRYLRSPVGRAGAAKAQGEAFFEIALAVGLDRAALGRHSAPPAGNAAVLAEIEALGWRLESAGYVSADVAGNEDGRPVGIYLFRNVAALSVAARRAQRSRAASEH